MVWTSDSRLTAIFSNCGLALAWSGVLAAWQNAQNSLPPPDLEQIPPLDRICWFTSDRFIERCKNVAEAMDQISRNQPMNFSELTTRLTKLCQSTAAEIRKKSQSTPITMHKDLNDTLQTAFDYIIPWIQTVSHTDYWLSDDHDKLWDAVIKGRCHSEQVYSGITRKYFTDLTDILHTYASPWMPVLNAAELLVNATDQLTETRGRLKIQRARKIGERLEALKASENVEKVVQSLTTQNISRTTLSYVLRQGRIQSAQELLECMTLQHVTLGSLHHGDACQFVVYQKLGKGRVSDVFAAYDREGKFSRVAIKVVKDDLNRYNRKQYTRNVRILPRHQNLCELFADLSIEGKHIQIYELFSKTLRQRIDQCKPKGLPIEEVISYYHQIYDGLSVLETAGSMTEGRRISFFHPDLAPNNIGITEEKVIKLTDFNPAPYQDNFEPKSGPIDYLSPLALYAAQRGEPYAISKFDNLFALATMTFEMLTGRKPFSPPESIDRLKERAGYRNFILAKMWKYHETGDPIKTLLNEVRQEIGLPRIDNYIDPYLLPAKRQNISDSTQLQLFLQTAFEGFSHLYEYNYWKPTGFSKSD